MPRNVRRYFASFFLVLLSLFVVNAQTSADVMRERISKAKSFIAVKNYNAAIYELENIRRETNDSTVHSVINVLLMNSYLEQGDYKRAQAFLNELAAAQKANKPNAATNYLTVAAQVIKGARNQAERYRALGLSVVDKNLPQDAVNDLEKMRETLEIVVEQSKVIGKDKAQTSSAMALLEEAGNARSTLAKDDFDANRWKNEIADAREVLANSRSTIINVVNDGVTTATETLNPNTVATNNQPTYTNSAPVNSNTTAEIKPPTTNPSLIPVTNPNNTAKPNTETAKPQTNSTATNTNADKPVVTEKQTPKEEVKKPNENQTADSTNKTRSRLAGNTTQENKQPDAVNAVAANTADLTPMAVGSLIEYATQKVNPMYPMAAKNIRQTGTVKVEIVIGEDGEVAEVQKTSGPGLLKQAAVDALRKWKFKPFMRDGQPVKATGFVSFNFNL